MEGQYWTRPRLAHARATAAGAVPCSETRQPCQGDRPGGRRAAPNFHLDPAEEVVEEGLASHSPKNIVKRKARCGRKVPDGPGRFDPTSEEWKAILDRPAAPEPNKKKPEPKKKKPAAKENKNKK